MKKIETEELKNIELDILDYIDEVCRRNNINYSLAFGTLLGAIRHKGFIPWDDDIDIMLIRSEYNKLIDVLKHDNHDYYRVLTPDDKGYWYGFAKVVDSRTVLEEKNWPTDERIGVFVDVFPMDFVPENNEEEIIEKASYYDMKVKYNLTNIAYVHNNKVIKLIKKIVRQRAVRKARAQDEFYWKAKMTDLLNQYSDTKNVACAVSPPAKICKAEYFENYADTLFENKSYRIINNYKDCLTEFFGDYNILPPESERVSNHDFTAYYKDS